MTVVATKCRLIKLCYWLQLLSFLFGVTYLLAIVINYVYRPEVKSSWLESHFVWQARTFWFSLLWGCVGAITLLIYVGHLILFVNLIWIIYRNIRGLRRLAANKPMYGPAA